MSADDLNIDTLIAQCHRREDPRTQVRAMLELARSDAQRAVPAILPLLAAEDAEVRMTAAHVLGQLGDHSVGVGLEALLSDADDSVRNQAAEALGLVRYKQAREKLEYVVLHDMYWVTRSSAAWALGELGDARALPALESALADEVDPVRGYVALAIGLLGDESQLPRVRTQLFVEPDTGNRAELLIAALRCGDSSAFDELLALLDAADDEVGTELHNAIKDVLSRKTPPIVVGRAAELDQRLAKLGSTSLQERLGELVRAAASDTP